MINRYVHAYYWHEFGRIFTDNKCKKKNTDKSAKVLDQIGNKIEQIVDSISYDKDMKCKNINEWYVPRGGILHENDETIGLRMC